MKPKIGVIGSGVSSDESLFNKAREIGKHIAKNDCILLTGGCAGIPFEAAKSAKENGGLTIAFSPAHNIQEHKEKFKFPADSDIFICTGFGLKGRNVPMIRSCDAVIAICGRIGTLNEITIAYDEKKVIGILEGTGGMSDKIKEIIASAGKEGGKIIYNSDTAKLVEAVLSEIK